MRLPVVTFAVLGVLSLASCNRGAPSATHRSPVKSTPFRATPGFVLVRAGSFTMGSAEDEANRYTNESQHEVTLTRGFEISATEVTQEAFQAVMGYNPSHFKGCPTCPVETVSWHEAAAYCNALSAKAGLAPCYSCQGSGPAVRCDPAPAHAQAKVYDCPGYRLPTDAEWEYAYRAGTRTPYYNGTNDPRFRVDCTEVDPVTDEIGWYCANSSARTHPARGKKPNGWGLYDMAGNVWEWCHDKYLAVLGSGKVGDPWGLASSSMQVIRGGAWKYYSRGLRAAARAWYQPFYRGNQHGFRIARSQH